MPDTKDTRVLTNEQLRSMSTFDIYNYFNLSNDAIFAQYSHDGNNHVRLISHVDIIHSGSGGYAIYVFRTPVSLAPELLPENNGKGTCDYGFSIENTDDIEIDVNDIIRVGPIYHLLDPTRGSFTNPD